MPNITDAQIKQDPLAALVAYTENLTPQDVHVTKKEDLEKIQKNLVKTINCLQYIEKSIDAIADWIDKKQIPYANEKDEMNGVLRDTNGTSFHVANYTDGKTAKNFLLEHIAGVKTATQKMHQEKKLIKFIEKFQYQGKVGCLEARTEKALSFAAGLGDHNLDQEMNDLFKSFSTDTLTNYQIVYHHFLPLLDKSIAYNNQDIVLTKAVLDEYMENLGQEFDNKAAMTCASLFEQYKDNMIIKLGMAGMVQVHVTNDKVASHLVMHLKSDNQLQAVNINQCMITPVNSRFMFRLSPRQFNTVFGKGCYDRLQAGQELTGQKISAFINPTAVPVPALAVSPAPAIITPIPPIPSTVVNQSSNNFDTDFELVKNVRDLLLRGSYRIRFWGGQNYTCPYSGVAATLPQTAFDIVTKIDDLFTNIHKVDLNVELDNIKKLLATKTSVTFLRSKETAEHYQSTLNQMSLRK